MASVTLKLKPSKPLDERERLPEVDITVDTIRVIFNSTWEDSYGDWEHILMSVKKSPKLKKVTCEGSLHSESLFFLLAGMLVECARSNKSVKDVCISLPYWDWNHSARFLAKYPEVITEVKVQRRSFPRIEMPSLQSVIALANAVASLQGLRKLTLNIASVDLIVPFFLNSLGQKQGRLDKLVFHREAAGLSDRTTNVKPAEKRMREGAIPEPPSTTLSIGCVQVVTAGLYGLGDQWAIGLGYCNLSIQALDIRSPRDRGFGLRKIYPLLSTFGIRKVSQENNAGHPMLPLPGLEMNIEELKLCNPISRDEPLDDFLEGNQRLKKLSLKISSRRSLFDDMSVEKLAEGLEYNNTLTHLELDIVKAENYCFYLGYLINVVAFHASLRVFKLAVDVMYADNLYELLDPECKMVSLDVTVRSMVSRWGRRPGEALLFQKTVAKELLQELPENRSLKALTLTVLGPDPTSMDPFESLAPILPTINLEHLSVNIRFDRKRSLTVPAAALDGLKQSLLRGVKANKSLYSVEFNGLPESFDAEFCRTLQSFGARNMKAKVNRVDWGISTNHALIPHGLMYPITHSFGRPIHWRSNIPMLVEAMNNMFGIPVAGATTPLASIGLVPVSMLGRRELEEYIHHSFGYEG